MATTARIRAVFEALLPTHTPRVETDTEIDLSEGGLSQDFLVTDASPVAPVVCWDRTVHPLEDFGLLVLVCRTPPLQTLPSPNLRVKFEDTGAPYYAQFNLVPGVPLALGLNNIRGDADMAAAMATIDKITIQNNAGTNDNTLNSLVSMFLAR